jgi:hypothetical protein
MSVTPLFFPSLGTAIKPFPHCSVTIQKTTLQVTHNIYTIYASYDTKYCIFDRFSGKKNGVLP